jgi:hypothetical protein
MPMIPTHAPSGSAARPAGEPELPGPSGGGGGGTQGGGGQAGSGSLSMDLGNLASGVAGGMIANAMRGGGGKQAPTPPPDEPEDPMVAALMKRGFSQSQALQYAASSAAIAPGKGVPPLRTPGPPPAAPTALPGPSGVTLTLSGKQPVTPKILSAKQLMPPKAAKPAPAAPSAPQVDPSVIQGLMKRGFTREQAIAVAGKATVTGPQAKQQALPPPPAPSGTSSNPATAASNPAEASDDMPVQQQVEAARTTAT